MNTNKYTISSDDNFRFQIIFDDKSKNIIGLRSSPCELESKLHNGVWLVLVFAVWDSNDRPAIDIAYTLASNAIDFQVAVRPFELREEFKSWAPEFSSVSDTMKVTEGNGEIKLTSHSKDHPIWLAIRGGEIIGTLTGIRSESKIKQFVNAHICPCP